MKKLTCENFPSNEGSNSMKKPYRKHKPCQKSQSSVIFCSYSRGTLRIFGSMVLLVYYYFIWAVIVLVQCEVQVSRCLIGDPDFSHKPQAI